MIWRVLGWLVFVALAICGCAAVWLIYTLAKT